MGKFYGDIGFSKTSETDDGIWEETITTKKYYGDITDVSKRFQNNGKVNEDVQMSAQISIIADSYAFANCASIKYVNWMGSNWKVSYIDPKRPRLILVLGGGLYNANG